MPHIICKARGDKIELAWLQWTDLCGGPGDSGGPARQRPAVLGHHAANLILTEPMPPEVQSKVAWLSQSFGVWPVRTKQDVICADEILQLTQVVFVERSYPDVLAELVDR